MHLFDGHLFFDGIPSSSAVLWGDFNTRTALVLDAFTGSEVFSGVGAAFNGSFLGGLVGAILHPHC